MHVSCHDETGPCGAAWTCGCTDFAATGINPDGSHWHTSAGGSEIHAVPNEPLYCAIREAAEDAGVEYLLTDLTITLPVAHIEWDEGPVLSCDGVDLTIPNQGYSLTRESAMGKSDRFISKEELEQ